MKDQLRQYVELLFTGSIGTEEIKQEILQNTLDRYDDLIAQGKSPEAAYRLAISGIGDIGEILETKEVPTSTGSSPKYAETSFGADTADKRLQRSVAIGFYILSPIPLLILSEFGLDTMGLCFTLLLIAGATVLLLLSKKTNGASPVNDSVVNPGLAAEQGFYKSISALIWCLGVIIYLIVSFKTNAWFITWLVFPIVGQVQGIVKACMDLKEVGHNEN